MSALTSERATLGRGTPVVTGTAPAGVDHIYRGGGVVLNSSGYAVAAGSAAGVTLGKCTSDCDNSGGSAGDKDLEFEGGIHRWVNGDAINDTDRGNPCYWSDDQTVNQSSSGGSRSVAGLIVDVDSLGVWVDDSPAGVCAAYAKGKADAATGMVYVSQSIGHNELTSGDTEKPFAAALPTGAVVFGAVALITECFSGGSLSAIKLECGLNGGDEDCIFDAKDVFTGAVSEYKPNGVRGYGDMGGETPTVHVNGLVGDTYDHITAGHATVGLWYCVPA